MAHLFKIGKDPLGRGITPVRQHDDIIAIVTERLRLFRFDDQRAVQSGLFLKAGVTVIPVGAALVDIELVGKGLARGDAVKAEPRYAVHLRGQNDAVPVDG